MQKSVSTMTAPSTFYTDDKHEYFFIRNGNLYEVYAGLIKSKTRHRLVVDKEPDCDKLTNEQVQDIQFKYLK